MTQVKNDNIIILMIEKVYKFIKDNKMFDSCKNVVVGISGGADSVCLLIVLIHVIRMGKYNIKITGVHVNHGIRGSEAKRDEEFAKALCEKYNVNFKAVSVDVPKLAKERKLSEEEAGRIARYEIFNTIAAQYGYDTTRIAVAHHINDLAETVLMNMFRGSSLTGLAGIKPVRDNVIRPLICVERREIEAFLTECGEGFITDSTNLDNEYTRNKIRNTLIPFVQNNINELAPKHICAVAQDISEADTFITKMANVIYDKKVTLKYDDEGNIIRADIDISKDIEPLLLKYVIRRVMGELAGHLKDVYKTHILSVVDLVNMQSGKMVDMPYNIIAKRSYDKIIMYKKVQQDISENDNDITISIENSKLKALNIGEQIEAVINEECYIPNKEKAFIEKITFERVLALEKTQNNSYTIYFDCNKLNQDIVIRKRQASDYIIVNLDGTKKKLKKELIDRKIPSTDRDNILLCATGSEVLWICAVRRSETARIDSNLGCIIKASIHFSCNVK